MTRPVLPFTTGQCRRFARADFDVLGEVATPCYREQVIQDRRSGMSLTQVAKKHGISRASVSRLMKESSTSPDAPVPPFTKNTTEQANAAGAAQ